VRRREFLASASATALLGTTGPAPRGAQQLRVLLGRGDARSIDEGSFSFNGHPYRGTFSTLQDSGEIVSVVPLEQYLYSVVPREMPRSWPAAALQAQAAVARTYVLQRSSPLRAYDLVPSEANQVYAGMEAEAHETTRAVDATSGQVLRFAGGFAQIAYSSCCGGHTEASSSAWGTQDLPYLRGRQCNYCSDSPWYRWSHRISIDQFVAAMRFELAPAGTPNAVTLDPPDESGRVLYWTVQGDQGSARIKAADIRRAVGSRTLPSLLVTLVSFDGSDLALEGGGLGHGVGLCQWGARGIARSGADFRAILRFYFPGSSLGMD